MKKLVIDLGHGGKVLGSIGQKITCKANIVLAIGKDLNEILKDSDLYVKFTRLSDSSISLIDRSKIANAFDSDYFLSIHINSTKDINVRGVEVWEYSKGNVKLDRFSNGIYEDISAITKRHLIELFDLKISNTDKLYRVCVGEYKDKSNAINQMNLSKGKGFVDSYIV